MNDTVTQRAPETTKPETERVSYQVPAVNIFEAEDGYTLEADLPGVTREGLEVFLDRNELTLLARRPVARTEMAHYRESSAGAFRRVFELNPEIDTDKITARVENGVLTLHLAKRDQVKPRRIQVTN